MYSNIGYQHIGSDDSATLATDKTVFLHKSLSSTFFCPPSLRKWAGFNVPVAFGVFIERAVRAELSHLQRNQHNDHSLIYHLPWQWS
jgi:hypothetical protein